MDKELCSTCLSKHRTLIPLSAMKGFNSHLKSIRMLDSEAFMCWECRAVLQKIHKFMEQTSKAQELLKLFVNNQKSQETLQSLSKLTISIKTDYDKNIVYCLKREVDKGEDVENLQNEVKYENGYREETIPKIEKVDDDFQDEFCMSEPADASAMPFDMSAEDSDEKPLILKVKKKKLKHKIKSDKKIKPKKYNIEDYKTKLSKDEEKFIINKMSLEEVYRLREEDKKNSRYVSSPFKCETCVTGYFSEDKYKAHVDMRHGEKSGPYICDICLTRYKRARSLAHHHELHLRSYRCRECNFVSHRLNTMLIHRSEHTVQKFTCKLCDISFFKLRQLRYHVDKAHKQRPACDTCGKEFVTEDVLRKHVLVTHGNVPKVACTQCGGKYRNIRAHVATHAPPAPDAFCVECGLGFRSQHIYRRHLRVHSKHRLQNDQDLLKYVCDTCARRFGCKTSLQRHVAARHTKLYPFNCDICSKGFSRRDRLKNHVLERHEGGQRPREKVCSYCGKAFKTKQVLIHHIRTHTGEKPHSCQQCGWSFAQRATLTAHTRALHGNTGGGGNTVDGGNTGTGCNTDGVGGKREP